MAEKLIPLSWGNKSKPNCLRDLQITDYLAWEFIEAFNAISSGEQAPIKSTESYDYCDVRQSNIIRRVRVICRTLATGSAEKLWLLRRTWRQKRAD